MKTKVEIDCDKISQVEIDNIPAPESRLLSDDEDIKCPFLVVHHGYTRSCSDPERYKNSGGLDPTKDVFLLKCDIDCEQLVKRILSLPAPSRLLTDAEVTEVMASCSDLPYPPMWFDDTMKAALKLCQAQDAKTYPLAFEAGRKEPIEVWNKKIADLTTCLLAKSLYCESLEARAEKDNRQIKNLLRNETDLHTTIKQLQYDVSLAKKFAVEAEKRGTRETIKELELTIDAATSVHKISAVEKFIQAKLKSLEER